MGLCEAAAALRGQPNVPQLSRWPMIFDPSRILRKSYFDSQAIEDTARIPKLLYWTCSVCALGSHYISSDHHIRVRRLKPQSWGMEATLYCFRGSIQWCCSGYQRRECWKDDMKARKWLWSKKKGKRRGKMMEEATIPLIGIILKSSSMASWIWTVINRTSQGQLKWWQRLAHPHCLLTLCFGRTVIWLSICIDYDFPRQYHHPHPSWRRRSAC